jgi:Ca2+-binding EF-hand superfamily protein
MKRSTIKTAAIVSLSAISFGVIAASFNDADKNGDGALSLAELQAAGMDDYVAKFASLDTDKDGKLSKAEAKANR